MLQGVEKHKPPFAIFGNPLVGLQREVDAFLFGSHFLVEFGHN